MAGQEVRSPAIGLVASAEPIGRTGEKDQKQKTPKVAGAVNQSPLGVRQKFSLWHLLTREPYSLVEF